MEFNTIKAKIIKLRDLPENFFSPDINDTNDTRMLKNIDKAIEMLKRNIDEKNSIVIASDVDIDGVTATIIPYQWLKALGTNVTYITQEKISGHSIILKNVPQCDLLIVVDSSSSETKRLGELIENNTVKEILIIDHHEIENEIVNKEYITVINAHQNGCEYKNKSMSGALSTWKVFEHLEKTHFNIGKINSLLYLASMSLISDSMDILNMENRYYFYAGNRFDSCAFQAIDTWTSQYSSTKLSFAINPLLNATIRDGKIQLVFDFLLSKTVDEAKVYLKEIETIYKNNKSKAVEAMQEMDILFQNKSIMLIKTDFVHKGYLASRITSAYDKSIIMLGKTAKLIKGKRLYTGSARALDENVMLKDIVNNSKLANGIGHMGAMGISIETKNIKGFIEYLKTVDIPAPKHEYDFLINIDELKEDEIDFVSYCNFLSGKGFKEIQYRVDGLIIKAIKQTGSGNQYILSADGIRFSQHNKHWLDKFSVDDSINVVFSIKNEMYWEKAVTVAMTSHIEEGNDDDLWK